MIREAFDPLTDPTAVEDYRELYTDPNGADFAVKPADAASVSSPRDERYMRAAVGRAIDGRALAEHVITMSDLPDNMVRDDDNADWTISNVLVQWAFWHLSTIVTKNESLIGDAWRPQRLEHHVSAAAADSASSDVVLEAYYDGGGFDWDSFDERVDASLGAETDGAPTAAPQDVLLPTPVLYPGMPNPRWWEFEDRQVSFPDVDASNLDLARIFVLDFALVYGNDWFTVPLTLPVGSVAQIDELRIFDTFNLEVPDGWGPEGEPGFVVPPADAIDNAWRMYRISQRDSVAIGDYFFLPPSMARSLESEPIEAVSLIRDEIANLAWGIESTVPGAAGYPADREDLWRRTLDSPFPASDDGEGVFDYTLSSDVPDFWYPLVPQDAGGVSSPVVELVRGSVLEGPGQVQSSPVGEFLNNMSSDRTPIPEEEVPRAGVELSRTFQMARWHDGSTVLWQGRRRSTGRGEGASHLRFDDLEPDGNPADTTFRPDQIADLAIWLDDSVDGAFEKDDGAGGYAVAALSDSVARWRDRSGNNYHQLQGASADQPIRTQRGLEFDGASQHMSGNLPGLSGDQEVTVFHVCEVDDYGSASLERQAWSLGVPWPTRGDDAPDRDVAVFCYEGAEADYGQQVVGVRLYGGNAIWPSLGTAPHVVTTRYRGGGETWEAWYGDSTQLPLVASSMPGPMNFTHANFSLGRGAAHEGVDPSRDEEFFDGAVSEVLVFLRALTDAERKRVVEYLTEKRGL
jgi:hypothetical protein